MLKVLFTVKKDLLILQQKRNKKIKENRKGNLQGNENFRL